MTGNVLKIMVDLYKLEKLNPEINSKDYNGVYQKFMVMKKIIIFI